MECHLSLMYLLVVPCILLIISGGVAGELTNPTPVAGLKCYECTSEDPGCDNNVNTTGTKYVKDCDARAIGCISWIIFYEFVFPPFLTRSCAFGYEGNPGGVKEQECLIGRSLHFWNGVDKSYSEDLKTYNQVVQCLKDNRVREGLPPPAPLAKNAPDEYGMVAYNTKTTELSNVENVDGNSRQWQRHQPNFWNLQKHKTPDESELNCYFCDEDVPLKGFGNVAVRQENDKIQAPLPQCEVTKRILCKKSYGCATLWEVRKEPEGLSSRIWRGCWHPGDQLCLRRPRSKHGDKGVPYTALSRNSNNDRSFNKNCYRAYAQSRATYRGEKNPYTIQWAGTIVKETEALYNEYVQCRQDLRKKLGQEQLKSYSRNRLNITEKPQGEEFFAAVRYIFCGFTEGCNLRENEDDPWKAEPPGPEEPGPEPGLGKCSTREDLNSASKSRLYPVLCFFLAMISFNLL